MLLVLSSQVQKPSIKCGQYQPFLHRKPKQVSIGHLIVTVQTFPERFGQVLPIGMDWLIWIG